MNEPQESRVPVTEAPQATDAPADPVVRSAPAPAVTPPPPPAPRAKIPKHFLIIGILLLLGIIVTAVLYTRGTAPVAEETQVAVPPTVIPTPTPPPNISRLATTSAFAAFSQEIASFSAILESYTFRDSTLVPPILDLELNITD